MSEKEFEIYTLKKLNLLNRNQKFYRVYKAENDFIEIEAQTVHEAIDKAGIDHPYAIKILINRLTGTIDDPNKLVFVELNDNNIDPNVNDQEHSSKVEPKEEVEQKDSQQPSEQNI